jgi:hypothetical protein
LSTSICGNPALHLFGFGLVVADGFGIGYIIKENWFNVYGSAFGVCLSTVLNPFTEIISSNTVQLRSDSINPACVLNAQTHNPGILLLDDSFMESSHNQSYNAAEHFDHYVCHVIFPHTHELIMNFSMQTNLCDLTLLLKSTRLGLVYLLANVPHLHTKQGLLDQTSV